MRTPHSGALPRTRRMESALRAVAVETGGNQATRYYPTRSRRADRIDERPGNQDYRLRRRTRISTEMRQRKLGGIPLKILAFLDKTPCSLDRVAEAFQSQIPRGYIERGIGILRDEGLVHSKWRQWHVTREGKARLPTVGERRPSVFASTYVPPPTPPRRAGSDHSHIPSIQGGQKVYRR